MPIIPPVLPKALKIKLIRQIKSLANRGILPHLKDKQAGIQPAFWLYLQIVPRKSVHSLALGKPEGIRVILFENKNLLTSLDFLFRGKKLFFSSAGNGPALEVLINSLNKLEEKYRSSKKRQEVVFVHFILDPFPYLMVKEGKDRHYYHFPKGTLHLITRDQLAKNVLKVLENRTSISS
jgi:hypothetical protein